MDIATLDLPANTHATVLTGRDVVTGEPLEYVIVWADRTYLNCPRCTEPVAREIDECPVALDPGAGPGGQIEETDKRHGCGLWLRVNWDAVKAPTAPDVLPETCDDCESTGTNCSLHDGPEYDDQVAPGITADHVIAAACELAEHRTAVIIVQTEQIREDLAADLRRALEQFSEPLDNDETMDDRIEAVSSGTDTEPGVYLDDDGTWHAWEHDPAGGEGDAIIVTEADLVAAAR